MARGLRRKLSRAGCGVCAIRVWCRNWRELSGRLPLVVAQQSTKSFSSRDLAALRASALHRLDEFVAEPLMVSLSVVMSDVLSDDGPHVGRGRGARDAFFFSTA